MRSSFARDIGLEFDRKTVDTKPMLFRCLQFVAALTLLALIVGAPATGYAHGIGHETAHSESVGGQPAKAPIQSLSAPADHSEQQPHHPGCANCCACSGGACQGAATLPVLAMSLAPAVVGTFTAYDALSPPRRARASLEHPPKSFA